MTYITDNIIKKQPNFWNHALFHPTDAVEDPWGRRILDRIAADGAIKTVRIYSMFEDILYLDENSKLCYDFRLSDLRLDYLVEKGYDLLIAYGGVPDIIASSEVHTSMSKNKTRYKGKMWNTSPPKDMKVWEEVCYIYTKHIVDRYGIDRVSKWHFHCHNEPDGHFFFGNLPREEYEPRLEAYCRMYEAFEKGVRRVSDKLRIGGPATTSSGSNLVFLDGFLKYVKEHKLKLDYIALHNYGTNPKKLGDGTKPLSVNNILTKHKKMREVILSNGFENIEIVMDEWGAASGGFMDMADIPELTFRETEIFASYHIKLIAEMINRGYPPSMMICLSGQHEMVTDFTGFRNFFSLNFIAKPIYNSYILASKLGDRLLEAQSENENIFIIPTKKENGDYAVMLTYSSENFKEDIPTIEESVVFEENIKVRTVTVWCIDKNTSNPYRMWVREGEPEMTEEVLKKLRDEGGLKPVSIQSGKTPISLKLTPNSTYLITVEN